MIGPSGAVRVMLASRPGDFRKGINGLAALVRDAIGADPFYRQAQIFARQGVSLDRSTLAVCVGRGAFLLWLVHERLLETLKRSGKLFADETTAPVLDPGRRRTKVERLINHLKQYRRIATRYEKRAANYPAMVTLGMTMLWLT